MSAAGKLYYTPQSCGAANFIAAHVAGLNLDAEEVDIRAKKTASGADFLKINPKGNVPTIVLADGTVLNENSATLGYIADASKNTKVAPAAGTSERYLVNSIVAYLASELHSSFGPLFNPSLSDEVRTFATERAHTKLAYVENNLVNGKKFLVGNKFSIADSYCYIIFSWTPFLKLDLSKYPNISKYFEGIKALPEVQAAHARMAEKPATVL
eukprot:Nk52_evm95s164 gene=Nk52_evmTU95s164